jgi:uncharacterized protein HemX
VVRRTPRIALLLGLVLLLAVAPGPAVGAQEPSNGPATTETTVTPPTTDQVPTNDIVPKPNSGVPPQEAGDRGGALQLGLLALVVAAVAGVILRLVQQSRRARGLR